MKSRELGEHDGKESHFPKSGSFVFISRNEVETAVITSFESRWNIMVMAKSMNYDLRSLLF